MCEASGWMKTFTPSSSIVIPPATKFMITEARKEAPV